MNTEILSEFVELNKKKKALKKELQEVQDSITNMERLVSDEMISNEVASLKINDMTLSVEEDIYPKIIDGDKERAIEVLKRSEYSFMVTESYNSNSLKALLKSFHKNGESLPEEFEGVIDISIVIKPKVRV